jgi:putative heme-binding domain-containing protein
MFTLTRAVGCGALALAALASAQPPKAAVAAGTTNKFTSPEDLQKAAPLFSKNCAYCHGSHGEGGRGADLTTGVYNHGGSDAELYTTIRNGIPGAMPAVAITDDQAWQLVAFVKKLGSAGMSEKATGDPVAGKAIFDGKGKCRTCHSVGLEGGTVGPDLTDVGRRRDIAYLTESLVTPEADVPLRYRAVQVVLKNGRIVSGIRLNEDDISIQVRDTSDNIRSFKKDSIKEIKHDKPALMPAYGSILSKTELANVVAYLNSLRGEQ